MDGRGPQRRVRPLKYYKCQLNCSVADLKYKYWDVYSKNEQLPHYDTYDDFLGLNTPTPGDLPQ